MFAPLPYYTHDHDRGDAMDGVSVIPGQIVASPDGKKIFVTAVAGLDSVTIAYTGSTARSDGSCAIGAWPSRLPRK